MRRGESRAMILETARSEFADRGYAGARVARIAERTGLNKQLIYYYFQSKAGLYAAATAADGEGIDRLPAAAPTSASAPEAVRNAVRSLVASLQTRPELVALMVERRPSQDARAQARIWVTQAAAMVAAAVSHGQGSGYFRDDVDPDTVAGQAVVLCAGFLALRDHLGVDPEAWVRGVSETLLRAAAW